MTERDHHYRSRRSEITAADASTKTPKTQGRFRLPDPPERAPDEATGYDHLHETGNAHHLAMHFGAAESTLVGADRWNTADS